MATCARVPAQKLLSAREDKMPLSRVGVTGVSEPSHHSSDPEAEGWLVQLSSSCCVRVSLYGTQGQAWGPVCAAELAWLPRCSSEEEMQPQAALKTYFVIAYKRSAPDVRVSSNFRV